MGHKQNDPLQQMAALAGSTASREQVMKMFHNIFKVLAWRYTIQGLTGPNKERPAARKAAAKYRKLSTSFDEVRTVSNMMLWLGNIQELKNMILNGNPTPDEGVRGAAILADTMYLLADNVKYLSKMNILESADAKSWSERSGSFEFWAVITALVYDVMMLANAGQPAPGTRNLTGRDLEQATEDRRKKHLLSFFKNLTDFLRVAAERGHVTSVPKPAQPAFIGFMGTLSGGVGIYQAITQ
eukprot:TRINITY_DN1940_c0_g3_i1.p1 TRINITY_DN1940_c0_g3~~TRINITY_DN1940_c0_g3_i1.p1  ORF type:complete len:241 (+),score=52.38 TRINITY_DN1940_c0_g3_i1:35-757(+)